MCLEDNSPESIIGGQWRMVQYSSKFSGRSGFCQGQVVWDFVRSSRSKYCGKLLVYKEGQLNGEPAPYSCTEGSITLCDKIIYSAEDDFEWRVSLYHYRMLEGQALQLRRYDMQNVDLCRTVSWAECLVQCAETLLFEPFNPAQ